MNTCNNLKGGSGNLKCKEFKTNKTNKTKMITKVDYSKGLKHRVKLPEHALLDPYHKDKCFAFFNELGYPIQAAFTKIIPYLEMSKSNYMVHLFL